MVSTLSISEPLLTQIHWGSSGFLSYAILYNRSCNGREFHQGISYVGSHLDIHQWLWEQYVWCPSFNWSLPVGLDRRILYGSHRTLSIMAIMAPDNGVFRFSTLRTGMRSFAYGMEFPSVIINHEKMAAMVFRYEPCGIISSGCLSDIVSMAAI